MLVSLNMSAQSQPVTPNLPRVTDVEGEKIKIRGSHLRTLLSSPEAFPSIDMHTSPGCRPSLQRAPHNLARNQSASKTEYRSCTRQGQLADFTRFLKDGSGTCAPPGCECLSISLKSVAASREGRRAKTRRPTYPHRGHHPATWWIRCRAPLPRQYAAGLRAPFPMPAMRR